jgi:hypothetical protein
MDNNQHLDAITPNGNIDVEQSGDISEKKYEGYSYIYIMTPLFIVLCRKTYPEEHNSPKKKFLQQFYSKRLDKEPSKAINFRNLVI